MHIYIHIHICAVVFDKEKKSVCVGDRVGCPPFPPNQVNRLATWRLVGCPRHHGTTKIDLSEDLRGPGCAQARGQFAQVWIGWHKNTLNDVWHGKKVLLVQGLCVYELLSSKEPEEFRCLWIELKHCESRKRCRQTRLRQSRPLSTIETRCGLQTELWRCPSTVSCTVPSGESPNFRGQPD